MNKYFKNLLIILASFLLLLSILIFAILWTYSNKIPDYKFLKNYKPPVSSKVYSGEGELVSDFASEKRMCALGEAILPLLKIEITKNLKKNSPDIP